MLVLEVGLDTTDFGLYFGVPLSSQSLELLPLLFLETSLSDAGDLLSCLFLVEGKFPPSLLLESLSLLIFPLFFSLDLKSPVGGDLLLEGLFLFLSLDLRSAFGGDLLREELLSCLFL